MARAVHEIFLVQRPIGILALHVGLVQQSKPDQFTFHDAAHFLVVLVQHGAGAQHLRRFVLHAQHRIVHFTLPFRETSVHRDAARKITRVTAVLATEIHQDHIAIVAHLIVGHVVQHTGVVAAGDDRCVGMAARSVADEFMRDLRFDLVFLHAGFHETAHALEGLSGDRDRPLDLFHFRLRFP